MGLLHLLGVGCLTVLGAAYTSLCLLLQVTSLLCITDNASCHVSHVTCHMPRVTCQGSLVAGLLITFLPTLAVLGLLSVWLTVLAGYRHLGKTRHFTQTRYSPLPFKVLIQSCEMHWDQL